MASRLRISRTEIGAYQPPPGKPAADPETCRKLQALIRRYLPPVVATLLAEPAKTADGRHLDWFTPLAGQPTPLGALKGHERIRLRQLLDDRIRAIRNLAHRLPDLEPGTDLAPTLLQATTYPAEETIFSVDGQPVILFWGYGELPREEPPASARVSGGSKRWPWAALGIILLLGGLAWGAIRFSLIRWPFQTADEAAVLAQERAQGEQLRGSLLGRQRELADALFQCALQTRLDVAREENRLLSSRLDALQQAWTHAVATCRVRSELDALRKETSALANRLHALQRALSDRRAKCRDRSVDAARAETRRLKAKLAGLRKKLAGKLASCGKTPAPAKSPEVPPAPQAVPPKPEPKAAALPPCPGERPPEDAPDVAVVLDASGSMRVPVMLDAQSASAVREFEQCVLKNGMLAPVICAHLFASYESVMRSGRGPTRLEAAKQAVSSVISSLPRDVDVGLAVLEDCPQATDYGFFPGAQRGSLLQQVHGLVPQKGTPLANGLVQAARRVDGVRAPAVMVVVSDGKDSCNQNPCSVAASLKAAKPKLKINVVDIVGDGAVNCIANVTGGDVLTPRSGMSLDQLVRKAAREAQKPEHCK